MMTHLKDTAWVDRTKVESVYQAEPSSVPLGKTPLTVIHMASGHRFWTDLTVEAVLDILELR